MKKGDLRGYDRDHPVPDDVRAVYGIALPLFVEYVLDELIENHVRDGRKQAAREDVLRRVHELMDEAGWNRTIGRPESIGAWYTAKRQSSFAKPDADLRKRRRKLPKPDELLDEFEAVRSDLRALIPRREANTMLPSPSFEGIKRRYPELDWSDPPDAINVTPAKAARMVISGRYGVTPSYVEKVIKQARRNR